MYINSLSERNLHIIAFDIPYPPNYGGVIDVYYKIKALFDKGVKVHLHCFEYQGRERADELNQICENVYYYYRKTGFLFAINIKPYIVVSRRSEKLINNLLRDDYPILFEGLHSCYSISDSRIKERVKIYRESNIEHKYYYNLFRVEKNISNKLYFFIEAIKLRIYQKVLKHASLLLAVSRQDTGYLRRKFRNKKVAYLPSFHANNELKIKPGKGEYALYHGNIEVPENTYAAIFLIKKVFNEIDYPLIIAGMNPPERVKKLVFSGKKNVKLISNPSETEMLDLIRNAHINILVTFQATGFKLKLLNVLYNGRFSLVNSEMVRGTNVKDLCIVMNTPQELKKSILELKDKEFNDDLIKKRANNLIQSYSNNTNVEKFIDLAY